MPRTPSSVPRLGRLRAVRESQLLTQVELAEKAGLHHVTLSRIETGGAEPRFRTIRRLAEALGVDWRELVGELKK